MLKSELWISLADTGTGLFGIFLCQACSHTVQGAASSHLSKVNLSQHRDIGEFHASLDFLSLSGTLHLKPRLIFLVTRYNVSHYWLCFGYRERSHLLKDSLRLWHRARNPVNFVALERSSASLLQLIRDVMQHLILEKVRFTLRGSIDRFNKTWLPFIDYVKTRP